MDTMLAMAMVLFQLLLLEDIKSSSKLIVISANISLPNISKIDFNTKLQTIMT